ncbi:hypothetical protein [Allofournierella sp.]|uniref:hypothetical protein n=1 Tax=Allofournierella sp. TaxID=1940256 RepID=UPI003AEFB993
MKINTYGIKMDGLKEAAAETRCLRNPGAHRQHVQIDYDTAEGKILTAYENSGENWLKRDDPNVIAVTDAYRPLTMQEIADQVAEAVKGNGEK